MFIPDAWQPGMSKTRYLNLMKYATLLFIAAPRSSAKAQPSGIHSACDQQDEHDAFQPSVNVNNSAPYARIIHLDRLTVSRTGDGTDVRPNTVGITQRGTPMVIQCTERDSEPVVSYSFCAWRIFVGESEGENPVLLLRAGESRSPTKC